MSKEEKIVNITEMLSKADEVTVDAVGNVVARLISENSPKYGLKIIDLFISLF